MGTFASLSGVIGKSYEEVLSSLKNYTASAGGGLQPADHPKSYDDNCCILKESYGNTTIHYPYNYTEWDNSSEFISRELNTTVFSFHIHDGDFWMYVMYCNGEVVDQFNPVPDYWEENISDEEIESWKGDAETIARYVSYINAGDIRNYLIRWNLDDEENAKAYPDDECSKEDWQLLDFMKKLKLPYPIDDNGSPDGQVFTLWTNQLRLSPPKPTNQNVNESSSNTEHKKNKPWWKFW